MKKNINKTLYVSSLNFYNSLKENFNFISFFLLTCDAPDFWQFSFQDPASSTMEGIMLFNKHLLFIIIIIVVLVSWLLFNTIYSYDEFINSDQANFFIQMN